MRDRLRVAINAQLKPDGGSGGTVTVLRALAALARLEDGDEEYVFVAPHDSAEWLRSIIPTGHRVVRGPAPVELSPGRLEPFKRALGPLRPAARGLRRFLNTTVQTAEESPSKFASLKSFAPPRTKNFYEGLGCDVIHFPFQSYEHCSLPAVYNPHDLQHLHHPEFFTPSEFARREALHPPACRAAHTVVVASEFVKRDVAERYRIGPQKIQVIPWAPPPLPEPSAAADISTLRGKYGLSERPFALYPAMTWEHKNHLRLLEALAVLREREGLEVRFVFTGHKTDFWPRVERRVDELKLAGQVKFLGLVPREELSTLYRAAQFVFVPTLFEAASAPLFEAWQHGAPVACSSVTSLPEQASGAALLFDPFDVESIAAALARVATDAGLRDELRRRGAGRREDISLERTARAYRAVYRRAAGLGLCEDDLRLLGCDWTRRRAPAGRARTD
ncbi:MAG TPA: glycosyltransferase family 1 protein [Pyrinomonadaceae bacterium]|nr:glycosyltransferase family 1 protein [Pyrinomonadaceae bacterium]